MRRHIHHLHIIILVGILLIFGLILLINYTIERIYLESPDTFGVSFAPRYARELGLDPQATYLDILENLKVKHLRLAAYWDEIEMQPDNFSFTDLDFYVSEAAKHQAQVILAVGYKLPRWPECRAPDWLNSSDINYLRQRQLIMVQKVIEHYEKKPTITAWQVENEPLLKFGICPLSDKQFLKKEVTLVRSLSKKPVILTDSGELSSWKEIMPLSDILGTTLYRSVENRYLGTFHYPLRPWFYRAKSDLIRKFLASNNQKTIVSELQIEPWTNEPIENVPVDVQLNRYSLKQFQDTISYTRRTGFDEAYFWGVEWWYYLSQNGHPEYLQYAKTLFN